MERIWDYYGKKGWNIASRPAGKAGDDFLETVKRVASRQESAQADTSGASSENCSPEDLMGILGNPIGGRVVFPAKSRSQMTLEEYALYIDKLITQMRKQAAQRQNTVFVFITEEGYAAMKADPAYEAWVLGVIRADLNAASFQRGGRTVTHVFGATQEDHLAYVTYSKGRNGEKSFWELRREYYREQQKEYYKKLLEMRSRMRRIQQELFLEKGMSWAAAACEAKLIVGYPPQRPI